MYLDNKVEIVAVKLPEPGIVELECKVDGGRELTSLDESLYRGETFKRKFGDGRRLLVRCGGLLDLQFAHVVAESYVGNDSGESPAFACTLQFAVHSGDGELLLKLAMGQGMIGHLQLEQRQLELDLGSSRGVAALRKMAEYVKDGSITFGKAA